MDSENEIKIENNEARLRFESKIGEDIAFIDYRWYKGSMVIMETFVPESGRGKNISSALAKFALEYTKSKQLKLIVYCPYVISYMKKHPEYNYLLNDQYKSRPQEIGLKFRMLMSKVFGKGE